MHITGKGTTVFCTNCGSPSEPDDKFCTRCGSKLVAPPSESPQPKQAMGSESPRPWPFRFPRLNGEDALNDPRDPASLVDVKWEFVYYNAFWYESPSLPRFTSRVLLTNQRLLFLDANCNLLKTKIKFQRKKDWVPAMVDPFEGKIEPHLEERFGWERHPEGKFALDPIWVLSRAGNENLHREFMANPRGFSKAPLAAWWVHGYRVWTWVRLVRTRGDSDLLFTLELVEVGSQWGPGQELPSTHTQGMVRLSFKDRALRDEVERCVKQERDQSAESGDPFRQEFLANLAHKPESTAYRVYGYVVWAAIACTVPLGILLGAGAPWWFDVPVCVLFGWLGVRLANYLRATQGTPRSPFSDKNLPKLFLGIAITVSALVALMLILNMRSATRPKAFLGQLPEGGESAGKPANPPVPQKPRTRTKQEAARPSAAELGATLVGFANGNSVQDRDVELRRNCGDFKRVFVPLDLGNSFTDLCRYLGGTCLGVCDWVGRRLPCTAAARARNGTRLAFCRQDNAGNSPSQTPAQSPGTLRLSAPAIDPSARTVTLNGVDSAQPSTPFHFEWGDGTESDGFFPQTKAYDQAGRTYIIKVTAT